MFSVYVSSLEKSMVQGLIFNKRSSGGHSPGEIEKLIAEMRKNIQL